MEDKYIEIAKQAKEKGFKSSFDIKDLQEWLMDEHGVHVVAVPNWDWHSHKPYNYQYHIYGDNMVMKVGLCNDYNDALLQGLSVALKHLK